MRLRDPIARDSVEAQARMFALFVGSGLCITRADLSRASKIPETTLQGWASGTVMPLWAVNVLADHLPPEALNLLFAPARRRLVSSEADPSNWDDLAARTSAITFQICDARRDGHINHVEDSALRREARALIARLEAVVRGDGM